MLSLKQDVSRKDEKTGKHVKIGEYIVTVPTLEDIASHIVSAKKTSEEDGIPIFDNAVANWVQDALFAYSKASARNKLDPKTGAVKAGLKIAETWDEFTAEGGRGNNGAALALLRECREAFAAYIGTLGKSEAAQKAITQYFNNKTALELAAADRKQKVKEYIEAWADSLDEPTLERFQRPIENVLASCEAVAAADDF